MRDRRVVLALICPLLACSARTVETPPGQSTAADTAAEPTITFTAGWTQSAPPLVAGQRAQVSYDPARLQTCRGNLGYGTGVGWSISGLTSVNGIALNEPLAIAGAGAASQGSLPSLVLPFAGTLELWFENNDVFGCNAWDSNYGANYSFPVAPPANAPGWVSGGSSVIDRATCAGGPCYADAQPADGGVTFGTWARQQAAVTQLFFDVWKSGVTDFDNPELWQELDVESHRRGDPSQPFTTAYVDFSAYAGNNARYAVDLRALDLLPGSNGGALTSASDCPAVPATITADGLYVQATLELFFTVNGVAVQPAGGGAFKVLFQNYAGLYAVCAYPHAT